MVKRVKKMPKGLKGDMKQTEGSTPRSAMPSSKRAGKAREKRMENYKL